MPGEETKKPFGLVPSEGPSESTRLDDFVQKFTPDSLDPDDILIELRLPEKLEELLQKYFEPYGMKIEGGEVTDNWDETSRTISRARGDQADVTLVHMPKWFAANGNHAKELHKLQSALWNKTVRIIAPGCDNPSLAFSDILKDWGNDPRDERRVDSDFVAWNHLKELTAGKWNAAKIFRLEIEEEAAPAKAEDDAKAAVREVPMPKRDKVFISYAGDDQKWLKRLRGHLDPLLKRLKMKTRPELDLEKVVFDATKIGPGEEWRKEIDAALESAKVGVLLVSKAFLNSDFIDRHELLPILTAAKEGGLRILWVQLDVCIWKPTEIAKYQAVKKPVEPLSRMKENEYEEILAELAQLIVTELEE